MAKAGFTIQITGQDALAKVFNALPVQIQRKALRPALRAGAKVLREYVKAEARSTFVKSASPAPHVADTINIKAFKRDRSQRGRVGFLVITGKKEQLGIGANRDSYYPAHVEFGYLAGPRNAVQGPLDFTPVDRTKGGKFKSGGRTKAQALAELNAAFRATRRHIPANPWMRRGLEAGRDAALRATTAELSRRLKSMVGAESMSDREFYDDIGPDESADIF